MLYRHIFSANEECTRYPLILLAFYTKTGNLRSRLQKIDMMLEILEISLICQNVKKQSIFKKKIHLHHFLFFRRYSVHCSISMAKISYRPHVTPFFHLYTRGGFSSTTNWGPIWKTINTCGTTKRDGGIKCPLSQFGSSLKCPEYCIFRQTN